MEELKHRVSDEPCYVKSNKYKPFVTSPLPHEILSPEDIPDNWNW